MKYSVGWLALCVGCLIGPSALASNMLTNGDFLRPAPPHGTFITVDSGERYGGWRVAGAPGTVTFISGTYQHNGFSFPSAGTVRDTWQDAWANLAGFSQSATGIVHAPIATNQGSNYQLSFYVGNIYAPGTPYGVSSTVNVYENSTFLGSFTNSGGQGTSQENWQYFSIVFAADAPFTTIAFINGDPPGDLNCGVDDVVFNPSN
jgi:hypothetical protein